MNKKIKAALITLGIVTLITMFFAGFLLAAHNDNFNWIIMSGISVGTPFVVLLYKNILDYIE